MGVPTALHPRIQFACTPLPKSVTFDALAGLLKVLIALQDADQSQLCGSNDTAARFFTLPLYARIIFGRLVCPSESGAMRPNAIGE